MGFQTLKLDKFLKYVLTGISLVMQQVKDLACHCSGIGQLPCAMGVGKKKKMHRLKSWIHLFMYLCMYMSIYSFNTNYL